MPTPHLRGPQIPSAGDPILDAWRRYTDTAGLITPVASVAAARELLTRMADAGAPPTAAHPVYLDIQGVVYRCVGERPGGTWTLRPLNEVWAETQHGGHLGAGTYTTGIGDPVRGGNYIKAAWASVPRADYDRVLLITGSLWARVKSGVADMEIWCGTDVRRARLSNADDGTTSTTLVSVVRAGVVPDPAIFVTAARGEGAQPNAQAQIQLVSDEWTHLSVVAMPITMS